MPTEQSLLIKATFFSHTNDDNKDHDTGVYVEVRTADLTGLLAHAYNIDNSSSDATEYNDHSDHQFDLTIDSPGAQKSACQGFNVKVWQTTSGNDTWKFDARVILYFSDGTNLIAEKSGIALVNDNASASFHAS